MNAPMLLSPEALARIDREIAKYPAGERQSALHRVWLDQDQRSFNRNIECYLRGA